MSCFNAILYYKVQPYNVTMAFKFSFTSSLLINASVLCLFSLFLQAVRGVIYESLLCVMYV